MCSTIITARRLNARQRRKNPTWMNRSAPQLYLFCIALVAPYFTDLHYNPMHVSLWVCTLSRDNAFTVHFISLAAAAYDWPICICVCICISSAFVFALCTLSHVNALQCILLAAAAYNWPMEKTRRCFVQFPIAIFQIFCSKMWPQHNRFVLGRSTNTYL